MRNPPKATGNSACDGIAQSPNSVAPFERSIAPLSDGVRGMIQAAGIVLVSATGRTREPDAILNFALIPGSASSTSPVAKKIGPPLRSQQTRR